jgi:hypothetical protein
MEIGQEQTLLDPPASRQMHQQCIRKRPSDCITSTE